jgi:pimeloyl-ACP methyl ester carboxylesterase
MAAQTIRIDTTAPVRIPGAEGELNVSARLVAPPPGDLAPRPIVLFCFPGGSFGKDYFDMAGGGAEPFSFAQAMADRGLATVLIDHLGIGASSHPADGYLLHPDVVADANVSAVRQIAARLADGGLGYGPLANFASVGVGHSMGGMLTAIAQARQQPFSAVAILGSAPYGHAEILPDALSPVADDPPRARREIARRMREAGLPAYVEPQDVAQAPLLFQDVPQDGLDAMVAARTNLIRVCGLGSVVPQFWAPDAGQIEAPVFLAFGDRDLQRDLPGVRAFFSRSRDIRQLTLADTGHMHFAFPSRRRLFDELAAWAAESA